MTAPLTPEDLRHLAAIVRAEREVYILTQNAFASWLPLVEALVLEDIAIVAAIDPQRASRAQAAWEKAITPVIDALAAVWLLRYKRKGKSARRMAVALDRFRAASRARLAGVTKGTYESIQALVGDAQRKGYTEAEIRIALGMEVNPAGYKANSARIARTSVMSAYNGGAEDGYRDYAAATGASVTKTWHTILDSKARETHAVANDQTVGLDEPFTVGGYYCQHPGDDTLPAWEAINCRCIATFKTTGGSIVADASTPTELATGWRGPIAALDRLTGDDRWLATPPDGLRTREYPMTVTRKHVSGEDDIFIGTIENAWINPDDNMLWGEGAFDLNGTDGAEASRLVSERMLFTMSIDPDQVEAEQRLVDEAGLFAPDDVLEEAINTGVIPEGYRPVMVFNDWRLSSVALVSIPAYDEARIEPVFDYVRPERAAVATPDHTSSSMIALRPSHPYDFALDGGLSPEDLHVTLRYLGDAAAISEEMLPALQRAASDGALALESMNTARVAGYGVLGDEGAVVLFLNGQAIAQAHANVEMSLCDVEGLPDPHAPFLAHMTLGYGIDVGRAATFVGMEFSFAGTTFDHGKEITHHGAPVTPVVAAMGGQIFSKANFERVATGPTPLTVDEDGAVYGHVRLHGTCYQYGGGQGDGGYCVQPPPSACAYAKFHVHGAKMDDGSILAVGAITYGEGHESRGGLLASQRHYNDVATMAAKVVASEDEWGVWVAGEVLDSHREMAYDILLSPMSGHWEPDADNENYLEMLAAHIVVTPGYNVRRIVASFDESGNATAIIVPSPWQNRTETGTVLAPKQLSAKDHRRAESLAKRAGVDRDARAARVRGRLGL